MSNKLNAIKTKVLKAWYGNKGYDKYRYKQRTGRELNLDNPQTWTEKLMWLNYYWLPQIKSDCADKYKVREIITQKGYGDTLVKLLGRWDDANDIDFDMLPERFVLKCNHGCAMNILVEDKSKFDRTAAIKKLNEWKNTDYTKRVAELHYGKIKPCIICEEFLPVKSRADIVDYKIHCFGGEPKFIAANFDRDPITLHTHSAVYTPRWERMMVLKDDINHPSPDKTRPLALDKMIQMAIDLSKGFPYVRVDLYGIGEKVFFGELTFTPSGNILDGDYQWDFVKEMGKCIVLPESIDE